MDDLARRLVIARGDGIAHQKLSNELSSIDLLIIDDFLIVGIDSDAASDLFAILANRERRLPTMIASQTGPARWVDEYKSSTGPSTPKGLCRHHGSVRIER
ncbi:ATP-binding protein [Cryobacterium sp. TMT2-14]|uniref:ATP-binding protein n=1 Tax=Cryobacterium sp. TMT2-14 TaxID=1259245 RepID=UPI00106A0DAA|nr:ATP-binding protein [Cryobacterium sp. TMT2-14]TFC33845.1 hypothetical protein E3O28_13205 [Cryobacterium sp. TMT2-14]